ncbi:peptidoglycan-binding protein [Streptomyces sp. KM273126]|uniref:peptidoglycan-binding domain-containing protein n=1 Tax=Streptomyces sp. KM273126 TaxID=2545247 RepID=UPI001038DE9B|nr:peptidoglycan-binding domain-containing protein [Streptomyces sp. KM273126]MBA2806344.1 peptidoglycan-binding protein [Streptomyces sp. KM273126]
MLRMRKKRAGSLSRTCVGATALAATLMGVASAVAPSAGASVAQGSIMGAGWGSGVKDDFGDEGPLDSNSHRTSNATALWQLILRADGLYSAGIDCDYGPATTAATKEWQDVYGWASEDGYLTQDGSAGPKTFGTADFWLIDQGNNRDIVYRGSSHDVTFRRVNGVYQFSLNGAWRNASYTSASAC